MKLTSQDYNNSFEGTISRGKSKAGTYPHTTRGHVGHAGQLEAFNVHLALLRRAPSTLDEAIMKNLHATGFGDDLGSQAITISDS